MKRVRKLTAVLLCLVMLLGAAATPANACFWKKFQRPQPEIIYTVSDTRQAELNKIYKRYNFKIGWGLYDISGSTLKEVASYNTDRAYQSNCTIKAAMLLYICKLMDAGHLSLKSTLKVNKGRLHYDDFGASNGKYSVEYLLYRMIHVSNNACYEVFLRYVTRETFNEFLQGLGSGTVVKSYNYMGNCKIQDRATEWFALYNYCHSSAKHASHAWKLLCEAKFSPIRDGIGRPAAHKSGWHYKSGTYGTAGDCAVVKTDNGGCYLMIMFTHNNVRATYSQKLMRELAVALDHVWDEYYDFLPAVMRKTAAF